MSKKFSLLMAAILAAMPASGSSGIVQTKTFEQDGAAGTIGATFTAGTASGNGIVIWGFLIYGGYAGPYTIAVADDKASTGWQVDVLAMPAAGNNAVFIASNLTPTAGVKAVTVTMTGMTAAGSGGMVEVHGITGRGTPASYGSPSSTYSPSPKTIANSGANSSPRALAVHVFTIDEYSGTQLLSVTPANGTFVTVASNSDSTTGKPTGIAGYVLDTTTVTDSFTDGWDASSHYVMQALQTFLLA